MSHVYNVSLSNASMKASPLYVYSAALALKRDQKATAGTRLHLRKRDGTRKFAQHQPLTHMLLSLYH